MKTSQERMYEDMMRRVVSEALQEAQEQSPHDMVLVRKSGNEASPEPLVTLRLQAQTSENITGRYGITVWSQRAHSDTAPQVRRKAIERFFKVENTPPGSEHYTLYFRKPIDRVQADKFNLLFYHQLTPSDNEDHGNGVKKPIQKSQAERHGHIQNVEQEKWLYSYDWKPETLEHLRARAETAEQTIGYYGVTVWAWASCPEGSIPRASLSVVTRFFRVEQTTDDPFHYTIVFRKPLTQEQVDTFNEVFSKKPEHKK